MTNFEENVNFNRMIIKEEINIDEIKSELYLLIFKFLQDSGNIESAKTLENELKKNTTSSVRLRNNGEIIQINFDEMIKEFWRIPQSYLLDSLIETIKILRSSPNNKFQGLSSLLSSRFPSVQNCNKKKISIYPTHSHINITCSVFKRSYCIPKKLRIDDIKETIMNHLRMKTQTLGHLSSTYCIIFDRTGKSIITGSDDTLIKIWKTKNCQLLATLRGHSGAICDLAISYDNRFLASASCDKTVRIWDSETGAHLHILHGHTASLSSIKFCPIKINDKNFLISTGNDANLCVWTYVNDVFDNTPLKFTEKIKNSSQLICSAFSPGGRYLVVCSSDPKIYIYSFNESIKKIAEFEKHDDRIDTVEFSHSGEKFLTASRDGLAKIWYPRSSSWSSISLALSTSASNEDLINEKFKIVNLTWSLDDERVIGSINDHSIIIWNSETGNVINSYKYHNNSVFVIECHPLLNNFFLTAGHDGNLVIWNVHSPTPFKVFLNKIEEEGFGAIFDAKFSPCGFYITATDNTGHVLFFDVFSDDSFKAFPKEQFFQTDYKSINIIEDVVYDEESGLLPHLMPPPYLVNEEGEFQNILFQKIHFGRKIDNCGRNIKYLGFLSKDIDENNQTEDIERNDTFMYKDMHALLPITQEDINRWHSRKIVPPLSQVKIKNDENERNNYFKHELIYYSQIHESCDPQKANTEERKNKLLTLKSKVLMTRNNHFSDVSIFETTTNNQNQSHRNSHGDADPDYITIENSTSITTESSEESKSKFSQTSESYIHNKVKRELCTRRKIYQLHSDQYSASNSSETAEPVYPHLIQNSGITREWLSIEKPTPSPYFPQIGDIIVYHLTGHQIYVKHVLSNDLYFINKNRLCFNRSNLKSMEVCRVNSISFPLGYPYLCSVSLAKMDSSGTYSTGMIFTVQFTDISNLDDFIILKKFYDDSTLHNWSKGDSFKSFIDEKWWGGEITNISCLDDKHLESEFRSICVRWNSGENDTLSPWDLYPCNAKSCMIYQPDECDWSPENIDDACQRIMAGFDTIQILPQFVEIEKFLSEKSLETAFYTSYCKIARKISNRFYRRKKAIIWELRIIVSNLSSLKPPQTLLQTSKVLTQALIMFIKDVSYDVMAIMDKISSDKFCDQASSISTIENVTRPKRKINIPSELRWIFEADELLSYLISLSVAKPFIYPVDLEKYPDYLSFIKTPMNFLRIKEKLIAGNYITPDLFVEDIYLIINNSKAYNTNRKSNIYSITLRLNNIFNKKLEELLPKWNNQNLSSSTLLTRSKISSFLKYFDHNTKTTRNNSRLKSKVFESSPIALRIKKRKQISPQTYSNLVSNSSSSEIVNKRKKFVNVISSDSTSNIQTRSREIKKNNYYQDSNSSAASESVLHMTHMNLRRGKLSSNNKKLPSFKSMGNSKKILKSIEMLEIMDDSTTLETNAMDEVDNRSTIRKRYNLRSKRILLNQHVHNPPNF